MITNDCRTFLAAKTQSKRTFDLHKSGEIGGGNILCAIGLFSLLNLLSKVFVLAKNYDRYMKTETEKGTVNETDAFAEFISYLQSKDFDLGLPLAKSENKKIWGLIRDELSHMAWPAGAISSYSAMEPNEIDLSKLEFMVNGFAPPFYEARINEAKELICNTDRLYISMPKIVDLLNDFIDNADNKNVEKTYKWLGGVF